MTVQPVIGDILVRPYKPGDDIPAGWTLSALGRPGEDAVPVIYTILTKPGNPTTVSTPSIMIEQVQAEVANWAQDPWMNHWVAMKAIHDLVFPERAAWLRRPSTQTTPRP